MNIFLEFYHRGLYADTFILPDGAAVINSVSEISNVCYDKFNVSIIFGVLWNLFQIP